MHSEAFIYSGRFKSPRGINDASYLNPPRQIWVPVSLFDNINNGDGDSDYVWRMKMYQNRYQNEVSLFLEAIQTSFEKQNYLLQNNVNNGVGNVGRKRIKIEEDVNIFIRVHNCDVVNKNIDFTSNDSNSCHTSSSPSPYTSSPPNIKKIKAHKVLLSQRSEYFDRMFKVVIKNLQ
ncbi:20261_t:CDS:2 [Entrophospora sp. SA101]|nr:20261_t:CDS:2 [Entrophospora sp. SA101]